MSRSPKTREQLLAEAARAEHEILAIFADAEHWNRSHPEEVPIDVDGDGALLEALEQAQAIKADLAGMPPRDRRPS